MVWGVVRHNFFLIGKRVYFLFKLIECSIPQIAICQTSCLNHHQGL